MDPNGDNIAWSLEGTDSATLSIGETSGVLTFNDTPNYEFPADTGGDNIYNVTVRATDDGSPERSTTRQVTITVTDQDDAGEVELSTNSPRVDSSVTATLTDEDGSVTNPRWQWSNSDGVIEDATSSSYTPGDRDRGKRLTATASYTDAHGPGKTASATTTSPVPTVDPPVVDPDGEVTLSTNTPRVEVEITASLDDDSGGETNVTWQWSTSSGDISRATSSSYTPGPTDRGKRLTATASYTDAHGPGKTASATTTSPVPEEPVIRPLITVSGDSTVRYAENDTTVVASYTASNTGGNTVTWSLGRDDDEDFTIVGGNLRFKNSPDYESPTDSNGDNVYKVTVWRPVQLLVVPEQRRSP